MFDNISMYQAFLKSKTANPKGMAIYYKGKKISFAKLDNLIYKTADILTNKLDIKVGDVILLAQPNIPDVLIIFYALNKIGAIANFVHPYTPYQQVKDIIEKTNSKYAFLFEQRVAKEINDYQELKDVVYVTRIENHLPLFKKIFYHVFMNFKIRKKINKRHFKYLHTLKETGLGSDIFINHNDDTSILLHSGSTTGDPKTICLSNNAFNHVSAHYEEFASEPLEKMKNTGMLCVLPSFHGFGLCIPMHTALTHQFASVLIPKFTIENVVDALKHTNTTSLCGVPTMYEKLINDPRFVSCKHIKKIKVAYCGGDNMSPSLKERFDKVMQESHSSCRLLEGYGLTEAICVNCVNTYDNFRLGSIGKPMSGASFKIYDDDYHELKANEVGEIAIKSKALMNGYFNDEKATREAFHDGYLLTGDLGYIDEDGFVYFKQRKKRVIKASGVAIFPSEIETVIKKMNGVKEAVVISIPDEKLIHAAKAFVVLENKDISEESIKDFCKKYLIRWAVPKQIEFVEEIKYTLLGKADYKYFQNLEDERR